MYLSLGQLKELLLAESLRADYKWDSIISGISTGVAANFDGYTNRTLSYTVGKQEKFNAAHDTFILSCFPVAAVTAIDLQSAFTTDWTAQTLGGFSSDYEAGIVEFGAPLGIARSFVRLTYTGGYWYPTTAYPTQPVGSTAMPEDLLNAFRLQVVKMWRNQDHMRTTVLRTKQPEAGYLYDNKLDDQAEATLKVYKRHTVI